MNELELAEQMDELNQNLKQMSSALSELTSQLRGIKPDALKAAPATHSETRRTSGYVNWDSTHEILKTEQWIKMQLFNEHCRRINTNETKIDFEKIHMDDKYVPSEENRFPQDALYVNIKNPFVWAKLIYSWEFGYDHQHLLIKVKGEAHSSSSFEKEYGLKWVEPLTEASYVSEPIQKPTLEPKVSISDPVIPNFWSSDDIVLEELDSDEPQETCSKEQEIEEELLTRELLKKFTNILDKITTRNFETLLRHVKALRINNQKRMELVVELLFEKALEKPDFSELYAKLASELGTLNVPSDENPDKKIRFRSLIIINCQTFFETETSDKLEEMENELTEDNIDPVIKKEIQMKLSEKKNVTNMRAVANAKFIGELYKVGYLTAKILDYCLKKLADKIEENKLECLCEILITAGEKFDYAAKKLLDGHIQKMQKIVDYKSSKISSRVLSMIQDIIDLRERHWVVNTPRVNMMTCPKMMSEIQNESKKRALLIELMSEFNLDIGTFEKKEQLQISHKKDVRAKLAGGGKMYSVETLKLEAVSQKTREYIKHPPNCFTGLGDDILDKLQADPTSRGEMLEASGVAGSSTSASKRSMLKQIEIRTRTASHFSKKDLRKDMIYIIDQFIINPDDEELEDVFRILPYAQADIIGALLDVVKDKTISEMKIVAKSLLHLVSMERVLPKVFLEGLKQALAVAPNLITECTGLYELLGIIIAPHIVEGHVTFWDILNLSESIISANQGHFLLAAILGCIQEDRGLVGKRKIWLHSGMQLSQWMREEIIPGWKARNNF